jgi:hypothetical protein
MDFPQQPYDSPFDYGPVFPPEARPPQDTDPTPAMTVPGTEYTGFNSADATETGVVMMSGGTESGPNPVETKPAYNTRSAEGYVAMSALGAETAGTSEGRNEGSHTNHGGSASDTQSEPGAVHRIEIGKIITEAGEKILLNADPDRTIHAETASGKTHIPGGEAERYVPDEPSPAAQLIELDWSSDANTDSQGTQVAKTAADILRENFRHLPVEDRAIVEKYIQQGVATAAAAINAGSDSPQFVTIDEAGRPFDTTSIDDAATSLHRPEGTELLHAPAQTNPPEHPRGGTPAQGFNRPGPAHGYDDAYTTEDQALGYMADFLGVPASTVLAALDQSGESVTHAYQQWGIQQGNGPSVGEAVTNAVQSLAAAADKANDPTKTEQ